MQQPRWTAILSALLLAGACAESADYDGVQLGGLEQALGKSDQAPGTLGTTPGQSGQTPGQSGSPPPGQVGATPGQNGSAPGHGGGAVPGFPAGIYAGNEGNSSVTHLDAAGTGTQVYASGGFGGPFTMTGLAFSADGATLYFARPSSGFRGMGDGLIWAQPLGGTASVFSETRPDGSFLNAFQLATGPDGKLYALLIGPTAIVRYDGSTPTYVYESDWFEQTLGFAIDSAGAPHFSSVDGRVFKVTGPTTTEVVVDPIDTGIPTFSLLGIAFDAFDRLYVPDRYQGKLWRFAAPHVGTVIADAGDGLFHPMTVAVAADGTIVVANFCSGEPSTVVRLDASGDPIGSVPFADHEDGLVCTRSLALR